MKIESAIESALRKAKEIGIGGKDMTPFLLGEINQVTRGDSLKANQHLIENNVTIASAIAIELGKLKREQRDEEEENSSSSTFSPNPNPGSGN